MSDTWGPGVILITVILILIGIPCAGVAVLGNRLLNRLGYFPSKTPAIQKSILVKLVVIEIISVTFLLMFFHALSEY